jgi:hypothetical protein
MCHVIETRQLEAEFNDSLIVLPPKQPPSRVGAAIPTVDVEDTRPLSLRNSGNETMATVANQSLALALTVCAHMLNEGSFLEGPS